MASPLPPYAISLGSPSPDDGGPALHVVLRVQVAGGIRRLSLSLPSGARVADLPTRLPAALAASVADGRLSVARQGRSCSPDLLLADGDCLDLCLALRVDPKEARRRRVAQRRPAGRAELESGLRRERPE